MPAGRKGRGASPRLKEGQQQNMVRAHLLEPGDIFYWRRRAYYVKGRVERLGDVASIPVGGREAPLLLHAHHDLQLVPKT